jgi:hypothetical protein
MLIFHYGEHDIIYHYEFGEIEVSGDHNDVNQKITEPEQLTETERELEDDLDYDLEVEQIKSQERK